ncbi:MAG TPA: hypothetical protein PKA64_17520, partial [Myxococcota bacterium]|nr:hypothetical protein [Myxococcota bacterium]
APTLRREAGGLQITWPAAADPALRWDVWRDGARIADNLTAGTWSDGPDVSAVSPCYVITATWAATGLVSQPSPPTCWWGEAGERLEDHDAWSLRQISGDGAWSEQHGQPHFMDWGDPGDALELPALRPRWSGTYRLQLVYGNGAGPINTGVTCAVKRLTVVDDRDVVVHAATIAMPQLADWSRWEASTSTDVALDAGVTYRVQIEDDDNMSAFAHFTSYTGGLGGGPSTYNRANIHALRVMALDGDLGAPLPAPGVSLDGTNDIDAYPPEARRDAGDLGAAMETWDAFAVDHDDDNLYVTLVSPAFEQDYAPWMIYLEALDDPDAPATPGEGMAYSYGSQTDAAALPFRPTHVIALRAAGGVGPDGGPWPGVYRLERGAWTQIRRLGPGADLLLAADRHTLSARVSRHLLGDPRAVRLVAHVLWGAPGAEWKDLVPADHAPWSGDGGSLTLDFTAPRAAPGGP